jgi:hypothetical protein
MTHIMGILFHREKVVKNYFLQEVKKAGVTFGGISPVKS